MRLRTWFRQQRLLEEWIERNGDVIAAEIRDVLDEYPHTVVELREAIARGDVDGGSYSGECACLYGTVYRAHVGHPIESMWEMDADFLALMDDNRIRFEARALGRMPMRRPAPWWMSGAEFVFTLIGPDDTPETNVTARFVLGVVDAWIDEQATTIAYDETFLVEDTFGRPCEAAEIDPRMGDLVTAFDL